MGIVLCFENYNAVCFVLNILFMKGRFDMKKLMAVFFVVAVVTALFCGVTAFAAAEPATVVADEGWANATYDAETQILTNVGEGYSFKWTGGSSLAYNGTEVVNVEKVVFPSSVNGVAITSIPKAPLGSGSTVKEIVISYGIQKTEKAAFSGYKSLETAYLPSTLTTIGTETFRNCSSLKNTNIPYGVTKIDGLTYAGCSSLKDITIPDTVTSLGQGCFNLVAWETVVVPAGVTSIPKEGFKGCANLTSITFKGNITSIGADAFRSAKKLASMVFEANTEAAPTLTAVNSTRWPLNDHNIEIVISYPATAKASFEDAEYVAKWPSKAVFSAVGEAPVVGGCSISAMVAVDDDTTVTYSAVDTNNNASVVVLIALYNGDVMIGAKTVSMADTTATFTGVTGATKARIFMWNSLANATPLYESFEY